MKGSECMDTQLYAEGSIFYYENRTNTKKDYRDSTKNHDFIVSRPVYIVGSNEIPFDVFTVNICIITSSSNRTGIPVVLDGKRNGKILPYAIYSVHKEYLTRYIGQVPPEMKQEIREAISYHLGLSKEVPPYITNYKKEKEEKEKFTKTLTPKELAVKEFIETKCVFKPNYCTTSTELFESFKRKNIDSDLKYSRLCDFSKAITKLSFLFKDIKIEKEKRQMSYIGLSLDGNVHRVTTEIEKMEGIAIPNQSDIDLDIVGMSRTELFDTLLPYQKDMYDKLDDITKYQNYKKSPDEITIQTTDHHNARVLKKLIEIDVKDLIDSIRIQLENGRSPHELGLEKQYVLCYLSDKDLERWIKPKYRKKGIRKIKRDIHQRHRHLFQNNQ